MDLGLGRWMYMVLRQHSRIDLSLLQHQSTSEEKHGRLLKRDAVETAGPFSASSKQLTAPEEKQERLQDPSLQCQ